MVGATVRLPDAGVSPLPAGASGRARTGLGQLMSRGVSCPARGEPEFVEGPMPFLRCAACGCEVFVRIGGSIPESCRACAASFSGRGQRVVAQLNAATPRSGPRSATTPIDPSSAKSTGKGGCAHPTLVPCGAGNERPPSVAAPAGAPVQMLLRSQEAHLPRDPDVASSRFRLRSQSRLAWLWQLRHHEE